MHFFAKSVGQVRMRMLLLSRDQEDPRGEPESTTLLHCFQYYLASRVLAFFLIFRFNLSTGGLCSLCALQ